MPVRIFPSLNGFFTCLIIFTLFVFKLAMAKNKVNIDALDKAFTKAQFTQSEQATLGAGCFWCVEAAFESLDGVGSVVSGYMGGHTHNPTYEAICSGETGHAEVVQITYDPIIISYKTILKRFWVAHDPTTLNRQGADVGTQYRSVIFHHSEAQAEIAKTSKAEAESLYTDSIVTEICPAEIFYPAEHYHQDFYSNNNSHPYCQMVIKPKLKKLNEESITND